MNTLQLIVIAGVESLGGGGALSSKSLRISVAISTISTASLRFVVSDAG